MFLPIVMSKIQIMSDPITLVNLLSCFVSESTPMRLSDHAERLFKVNGCSMHHLQTDGSELLKRDVLHNSEIATFLDVG